MLRRGFWLAFWGVLGAVIWRGALTPARVRSLRVSGFSGAGPRHAGFRWGYGAGARPQSVIFDLELANGEAGSVTTDGEATEAEAPLRAISAGPYRVSAEATYRILGVVRRKVYRFAGEITV